MPTSSIPIYRDLEAMPISAQQGRIAVNRRLAGALIGDETGSDGDSDAGRRSRAVARHLVHYRTWRSLAVDQGLGEAETVEVAVRLLSASA